MYKCLDCYEIFADPDTKVYEEVSEYWGSQATEYITVITCPFCGSEDIEEVNECHICGEPTEKEYCDTCHKELQYYLDEIKDDMGIDEEELQDLITEHFGW